MSILSTLLSVFPRDVVCCILEYDRRFSVRNGTVRKIGRFDKKDERRKMVFAMVKERKLNLEWFDLEDWHDLRPQFVCMINPYDKYVLRIWNAEYIRRDTGETFFEMTRELMILRGRRDIESICEY